MIGNINKLAQEIQDSVIPRWLREYLDRNHDKMVAELKLFGECEIPMPDGGVIVVKAERP